MKKFFQIFRKLKYPYLSDKRHRFVVQTVVLTSGLMITQLAWEDYRFWMVGVLALLSYILTAWSLHEDIKGVEWLLLFILPVLFTIATSMFYFLLPARWIIRLSTTAVFAVGTYAILLVENIYNVAAMRSIQLLRAAQSIGLLLTLTVIFLSTNIIFSVRASFWQNTLYLTPIIFLASLQSLWSATLEPKITRQIYLYSLCISLGIGEMAWSLSFWSIQIATASLFITASFYALTGICQQHLTGKLFRNTVNEYLFVFIFTFLIALISSRWG